MSTHMIDHPPVFKDHNEVVGWMEKYAAVGAEMSVVFNGVVYIYTKDDFGVHHVAHSETYNGPTE